MPNKTIYEVLKVKANCASTDIENAWTSKKKSLLPNSSEYQEAEKAYYTLIDPVKREMYDRFRITEDDSKLFQGDGLFQVSENFVKCCGVKQYKALISPESEITRHISVTLEDLYNGRIAKIVVKLTRSCKCKGTSYVPCPSCRNNFAIISSCSACKGTGMMNVASMCSLCNGTNIVDEDIETEVEIKRGMQHNQKLNKVLVSRKFFYNLKAEFILKQKPHKLFNRQWNNLHMIKKISLTEALCGLHCVITHLDKRQLIVSSAGGVVLYPGCKQVVKGEGMPICNTNNKGDLIVHFKVEMPNNIKEDIAKEIEPFLPKRPTFLMPSNPETEEYRLIAYDSSYKLQTATRNREAYFDDKHDKKQFEPSEQCTHQ